jgi:hypothetical protein
MAPGKDHEHPDIVDPDTGGVLVRGEDVPAAAREQREVERREAEEAQAYWTEQRRRPWHERDLQWWYGEGGPQAFVALVVVALVVIAFSVWWVVGLLATPFAALALRHLWRNIQPPPPET